MGESRTWIGQRPREPKTVRRRTAWTCLLTCPSSASWRFAFICWHPKQSEIRRFCFQSLLIQGQERWGLQILLHEVRSREIFQVLALLNCRMGMSSPRVDRGHILFQEYPNEWSSLELRGGNMEVFQVKVLQVMLVRQLVDNVSEYFTSSIFAQNRGLLCSLARIP